MAPAPPVPRGLGLISFGGLILVAFLAKAESLSLMPSTYCRVGTPSQAENADQNGPHSP